MTINETITHVEDILMVSWSRPVLIEARRLLVAIDYKDCSPAQEWLVQQLYNRISNRLRVLDV